MGTALTDRFEQAGIGVGGLPPRVWQGGSKVRHVLPGTGGDLQHRSLLRQQHGQLLQERLFVALGRGGGRNLRHGLRYGLLAFGLLLDLGGV